MTLEEAISKVKSQYEVEAERYPKIVSPYEGYALILEEFDQLKTEVFRKPLAIEKQYLTKEASHVAAMAIKFLVDLCN